jgi:Delta7-sterol 5-desaturase
MDYTASLSSVLGFAAIEYLVHVIRYALGGGLLFFVFWVWKADAWSHMRIQQRRPSHARLIHELRTSLTSLLMFTLVGVAMLVPVQRGYTQLYFDLADFGAAYFALTVVALLVLQDAYFYWTHRLLHWRPLFVHVHVTHHRSVTPSPLAAFSFHPVEAVMHALFIPFVIVCMPVHPLAIFIWFLLMSTTNAMGHLGFEVLPRGFANHPVSGWLNTATHHDLHHQSVHYNFGLYGNLWDRLFGTLHPQYLSRFAEIVTRRERRERVACEVPAEAAPPRAGTV